jgi:hypothetical protein
MGLNGKRLAQIACVVATMTVLVGAAADVNQLLADAEGRKKAAENGLGDIKKKSTEQASQVKTEYTAAASATNAWLDALCQSIEHGSSAPPDVKALVGPAASAVVEWVRVRNHALGVPEMATAVAEGYKKSLAADLSEIAASVWKRTKGAAHEKRTKDAADLKDRVRWRSFDEIQ